MVCRVQHHALPGRHWTHAQAASAGAGGAMPMSMSSMWWWWWYYYWAGRQALSAPVVSLDRCRRCLKLACAAAGSASWRCGQPVSCEPGSRENWKYSRGCAEGRGAQQHMDVVKSAGREGQSWMRFGLHAAAAAAACAQMGPDGCAVRAAGLCGLPLRHGGEDRASVHLSLKATLKRTHICLLPAMASADPP